MHESWDIFCSVVDNYGDIGVTWRLARQLQAEHSMQVRLWVDDLPAFARLCPQADPTAELQWQAGVQVGRWSAEWATTLAADVVIGAFGCALPAAYIARMAVRDRPSLWLNLEYLSAESWVAGCHGLPSLQSNRLQKFFFFPGFEAGTGGLLREAGLLDERMRWRQDPSARRVFLENLGVSDVGDAQLISLFAYENPAVSEWLDAMAQAASPTRLLVPEGRVLADIEQWTGTTDLQAGAVLHCGALTINVLPFVSQHDYDRLLWCCDFNAVRGEDSFVRAQWSASPLLWHIYPQEEEAHWDKLEAFLALYLAGLPMAAASAMADLWHAWNGRGPMAPAWREVCTHRLQLQLHAERWCAKLAAQPDLAAALVLFYRNFGYDTRPGNL